MKTKNWKRRKNDDNEADSPRNKPIMDKSKELKITEEESDLENWKRKKTESKVKPLSEESRCRLSSFTYSFLVIVAGKFKARSHSRYLWVNFWLAFVLFILLRWRHTHRQKSLSGLPLIVEGLGSHHTCPCDRRWPLADPDSSTGGQPSLLFPSSALSFLSPPLPFPSPLYPPFPLK